VLKMHSNKKNKNNNIPIHLGKYVIESNNINHKDDDLENNSYDDILRVNIF
jgi:hypothetical protein